MNRVGITREDWAEFSEIQGYYKARGETLMAVSKVTDVTYRIALDGPGRTKLVVFKHDDNGNIIDATEVSGVADPIVVEMTGA